MAFLSLALKNEVPLRRPGLGLIVCILTLKLVYF